MAKTPYLRDNDEEIVNALLHAVGLGLALAGTASLVTFCIGKPVKENCTCYQRALLPMEWRADQKTRPLLSPLHDMNMISVAPFLNFYYDFQTNMDQNQLANLTPAQR